MGAMKYQDNLKYRQPSEASFVIDNPLKMSSVLLALLPHVQISFHFHAIFVLHFKTVE